MDNDSECKLLRETAKRGRIQWHQHAAERLLERGILRSEVKWAIINGEVIEVYPMDRPYRSYLILHTEEKSIHVVAAVDTAAEICHVITVYRPSMEYFEPDFRTRRKKP